MLTVNLRAPQAIARTRCVGLRGAALSKGMEGAGEDPYLGSQVAKAMVVGYQNGDLSKINSTYTATSSEINMHIKLP